MNNIINANSIINYRPVLIRITFSKRLHVLGCLLNDMSTQNELKDCKSATMATSNTDSYIPSTKQYQVLQKYFGPLVHTISDPVTLAADLFSAGLISESTRTSVNTESSTRQDRNNCILDELMSVVALDPDNLLKIISELEHHPPNLSSIAKKMKIENGNEARVTFNNLVDLLTTNS